MTSPTYILSGVCPDDKGIVAAVSGCLAEHDALIVESSDYGDPSSGRFFFRTVFQPPNDDADLMAWRSRFAGVGARFEMDWQLRDRAERPRVMILASKAGHCLNDLLYRYRAGALAIDIVAIVSNHRTLEREAGWHEVPFHHLPIAPDNKQEQEARLCNLLDSLRPDLVVLARYMQILSPELCARLEGRCINIHHSFLPGFKGARPYHQAHARGVKLIGATAHYVTSDLDEGPIIEQAVERVDHTHGVRELAAVGRDLERVVLARAVAYHVEHRVLLNGNRTVVLRG